MTALENLLGGRHLWDKGGEKSTVKRRRMDRTNDPDRSREASRVENPTEVGRELRYRIEICGMGPI